jgi:hypothetical protein
MWESREDEWTEGIKEGRKTATKNWQYKRNYFLQEKKPEIVLKCDGQLTGYLEFLNFFSFMCMLIIKM